MSELKVIRFFISSPGDVNPEREVARRVIERLNREFSYHFRIEAVLWEREPLIATEHFQTMITPPSNTDIVVVIVWRRLGSHLPPAEFQGKVTGKTPVTGTEWEFEDAVHSYRQNGKPDLLLYRKQAVVTGLSEDEDVVTRFFQQKKMVEAFLTHWFHDDTTGGFKAASHQFTDAGQLEEMLETQFRSLLKQRVNLPEGEALQVDIHWHEGSPFRGLESFDLKHAPIFFGRTKERLELRDALASQSARGCAFLLVFGASGSGKSSLVKAGLLSDLKIPGMMEKVGLVRHAIVRPTDDEDLYAVLAKGFLSADALPELTSLQCDQAALTSLLRDAPQQAVFPVRQGLAKAGDQAKLINDAQPRLLLIVDQLEELFTQPKVGQAEREGFVLALKALAESGQVWVIATMRSDFFDRLVSLPVLSKISEEKGRYLLHPPAPSATGQIIRQPAREAGLRYEKDPKTGTGLDELLQEAASRDGASLPLLSFTLEELWNRKTEQGVLTHAAYESMGRLEGSLGRKAEEVFEGLKKDEQSAFASVMRQLVTVGLGEGGKPTARTVSLAQFGDGTPARKVVDTFLSPKARLLVADADGTAAQVRVVHEALLSHWPRAAKQIEQDYQDLQLRGRLEQAAARWRLAGKKDKKGLLLPSGFQLQEGRGLLKRWASGELEPGIVDYVKASVSAHRRKRLAISGLAFVFVAVASVLFSQKEKIRSTLGVMKVQKEMAFVKVPGGCFQMGTPETDKDRSEDEGPVHEVCVDDFWLGKYEVTQAQWESVMLSNLSKFKKDGINHPVENVSWNDFEEFIGKMNSWGSGGYRLPTEAEWEYACRSGGKSETYAGGNDARQVAWFRNNSDERTHPVGEKAPNGFGLYDMSGNVFEWVQDVYAWDAYGEHARKNPIYAESGSDRVIRGGSWLNSAGLVLCANRNDNAPDNRYNNVGARLARTF